MAIERRYKLTAMLSDEEARMLSEVAERGGVTASAWIRQAIRQAFEESSAASLTLGGKILEALRGGAAEGANALAARLAQVGTWQNPREPIFSKTLQTLQTQGLIEVRGSKFKLTARGRRTEGSRLQGGK
ncbi:MAG TPA: hypothetical protein VGG39_24975 [Polyangiaceae bacterium]|jgi:predicted transcriptional regulator